MPEDPGWKGTARAGKKLLDKISVKCSWNHVLHGCFLCCMGNSVCRFECVEWEKGNECVFMREKEEGEILIPVIWQIGMQGDELHAGKGDA